MDPTRTPEPGDIQRECEALVERGEHPKLVALGRETLRRLGPFGASVLVLTDASPGSCAAQRLIVDVHCDPLGPAEYLHVWSHEAYAKVLADD